MHRLLAMRECTTQPTEKCTTHTHSLPKDNPVPYSSAAVPVVAGCYVYIAVNFDRAQRTQLKVADRTFQIYILTIFRIGGKFSELERKTKFFSKQRLAKTPAYWP